MKFLLFLCGALLATPLLLLVYVAVALAKVPDIFDVSPTFGEGDYHG